MNCGHQAFEDLEVVVDHLGDGGQAVGGAASVGDNVHGGLKIFKLFDFLVAIKELTEKRSLQKKE